MKTHIIKPQSQRPHRNIKCSFKQLKTGLKSSKENMKLT